MSTKKTAAFEADELGSAIGLYTYIAERGSILPAPVCIYLFFIYTHLNYKNKFFHFLILFLLFYDFNHNSNLRKFL